MNEGYNQGADAMILDVVKRGHENGIAVELLTKIVNLSVEIVTEMVGKI